MSALIGDSSRPVVLLNKVSKWTWRGERRRTIRVVVLREGERRVAQVYGAKGSRVELLEEAEVASLDLGQRPSITTVDGETWTVVPGGCACGSPLKRFNPLSGRAMRAGS